MNKILVTGGTGQIGSAICTAAARHGFAVDAPGRDVLDLERVDEDLARINLRSSAALINCGAYTAVDKAESEPERANTINGKAPGILASAAAAVNIPIIHVSTDYVFDGSKRSAYLAQDPVAPLGAYGASKETGERLVRAGSRRHAIIRTAWVVSAGGANFISTMLRLAAERDEVNVVSDQFGCPSSANDIAEALLVVTKRMILDQALSGTWHFVNDGKASWHDLAEFVFDEARARGLRTPALNAIATAAYPTPAKRPANSCLDTSSFQKEFGLIPRKWTKAVAEIMSEKLDKQEWA